MTNPKVEAYITKSSAKQWQAELMELRRILQAAGLTEDFKWRAPCYTYEGKNVAFIGGWKEGTVLSFLKGILMKDPKRILHPPGPNSQSAMIARFTTVAEILKLEPTLKAYVKEAIELEKSGAKVALKKIEDRPIPDELQAKFKQSPDFKAAFKALTPGRQRAYLMHFESPKQSATRVARIEKATPDILKGKGLNDDYLKSKASPPAKAKKALG